MVGYHIYNRLLKDDNAKEKFETMVVSIIDKVKE